MHIREISKPVRFIAIVFMLCLLLTACEEKTISVTELTEAAKRVVELIPDPDVVYSEYDIDYLILVDKDHRVPDDWEDNIWLVETTNAVGDTVRTERTAYLAYLGLKESLEQEGIYVDLDSAFRSLSEQQAIIDEFTEKYGAAYARAYASEPGVSEHHTGLALDLFLIVDGNIVYENEDLVRYPEIWEKIHSKLPEYGFILRYPDNGRSRYPYEPWHIRYVGADAAKEITESGLLLEEYLNMQD